MSYARKQGWPTGAAPPETSRPLRRHKRVCADCGQVNMVRKPVKKIPLCHKCACERALLGRPRGRKTPLGRKWWPYREGPVWEAFKFWWANECPCLSDRRRGLMWRSFYAGYIKANPFPTTERAPCAPHTMGETTSTQPETFEVRRLVTVVSETRNAGCS